MLLRCVVALIKKFGNVVVLRCFANSKELLESNVVVRMVAIAVVDFVIGILVMISGVAIVVAAEATIDRVLLLVIDIALRSS